MTYQQYLPGSSTTAYLPRDVLETYKDFARLPPALRGEQTHVIYLAPNRKMFNLAGPSKGKEGVRLAKTMYGDQNWPFDLVTTESAYSWGAQIDRVNVRARKFNVGVVIGSQAPQMTEYQYRMAEQNWWSGQDEQKDGWLGFYTRYTGWRWIPVRPARTVSTPQSMDSTAFGNNASQWDIEWYAQRPYFTKPALYRTWEAKTSGDPVERDGFADPMYTGVLVLANRGDLPSYVSYIVSPGYAGVQDNNSDIIVPLPYTTTADGSYLCDTEPGHRTLTASKDPVDNLFLKIARSSKLLNFFLHDLANLGLPLQLRFDRRFMFDIPPRTVVKLRVYHSSETGTITAFVPQRYKRSR